MLLQTCLEKIIIKKFVSKLVLCYYEVKADELIVCKPSQKGHDHTPWLRYFCKTFYDNLHFVLATSSSLDFPQNCN